MMSGTCCTNSPRSHDPGRHAHARPPMDDAARKASCMRLADDFRTEGFCVGRSMLPAQVPLVAKKAFGDLIDALAWIVAADRQEPTVRHATAEAALAYLCRTAPLLTASYFRYPMAARALWYRHFDLPSWHLPEAFRLLTCPALLDVVEQVLRTREISLSPVVYLNIKSAAMPSEFPGFLPLEFLFGRKTRIHSDAEVMTAEARRNPVVGVWIPLTEATNDTGTLLMFPGTHRAADGTAAARPLLNRNDGVPMNVAPGDAVFFDNRTYHAASTVRSGTQRWALSGRFMKTGTPSGTDLLPSVPVRSSDPQNVVGNPYVWQALMDRAVASLATTPAVLRRDTPARSPAGGEIRPPAPADTVRMSGDNGPPPLPEWARHCRRNGGGKARRWTADRLDLFVCLSAADGDHRLRVTCMSLATLECERNGADSIRDNMCVRATLVGPETNLPFTARCSFREESLVLDLLDVPLSRLPTLSVMKAYCRVLQRAGETAGLAQLLARS